MSEKELRKASKKLWYACTTQSQTAVEAMLAMDKALAADPDVVKVLRILAEAAREHEKLMDDEAQDWNAGYEYGFYDAAVSLAFEIEKALHIRLTDKGWEWIADA